MSDSSPILSLPYLMPAQAQKHVTHNQALQLLDALVQLRVSAFEAETPPPDPAPGAAFALGLSPTGAWAAHAQQLAIWQGEGWLFIAPQIGWRAWGDSPGELRIWQGSSWELPLGQTQNLPQLGINASADASNRLAVSAAASLFNHDGSSHQLKLNKATGADSAALLLQSDWSGHAEIGLLGNDDFTIKTSADGSSWNTALVLQSDGRAGLGTTAPAAHLDITGGSQDYLQAGDGSDLVFRLGSDGNGACDGAWSGGGADYAEWFEWQDGNPEAEDRRGVAVILQGDKIRPARPGEQPIGVISANPSLVGDGDLAGWKGKYLRDSFGAPVLDAAGKRLTNPDYDPDLAYQPRDQRPEWAMVGLLGKLRLRRDQPRDPRWIHMRNISDQVAEYLLR